MKRCDKHDYGLICEYCAPNYLKKKKKGTESEGDEE